MRPSHVNTLCFEARRYAVGGNVVQFPFAVRAISVHFVTPIALFPLLPLPLFTDSSSFLSTVHSTHSGSDQSFRLRHMNFLSAAILVSK